MFRTAGIGAGLISPLIVASKSAHWIYFHKLEKCVTYRSFHFRFSAGTSLTWMLQRESALGPWSDATCHQRADRLPFSRVSEYSFYVKA